MPCLSVVQVPFRCALAHPCACPWTAPYIMHTPVISARLLIRAPFRLVCYSQVEDSHFSKPICSKCAEKRKMLQGCKVHCSYSFVTRTRTHTHTLSLSLARMHARTHACTHTHPPTHVCTPYHFNPCKKRQACYKKYQLNNSLFFYLPAGCLCEPAAKNARVEVP